MDILELEDLFGANNRTLFGGNDPLSIAALVHSDPEGSPLPFLPSEHRNDNHPPSLVKTRSLVDIHTTSGSGREEVNKDTPSHASRVVRSQSAFPHLNRPNSGTHVDIHDVPPEMPIYLLQEDEGNDEEIMRLLLATEKESMGHFESDDVIPRLQREAHKRNVSLRISTTTRPATERNETQHLMKDNKLPSSQDLPVCDQPPSSFTGYNSSTSNKASGVVTTTIHSELQQVSHSIKHMTKSVPSEVERPSMAGVSQSGSSPAAFLKQGERRPLCGESSQHSVTKSKTKNEQMECVRQLEVGVLPLGSLTVRLPAVGNGGSFVSRRYQALPLESVPTSSHQPATRKRAHGGGWPKGKSRKIERGVQLPKLAATGYSIFLSEKRGAVQEECGSNSMSVLSKHVGKMWSQLSPAEKKVYYDLAGVDHQRYLSELKTYLVSTHTGGDSLEKVNEFIRDCFSTEESDEILLCPVCSISFASLYNKRSHFSGKLHQQALVQELSKIIGMPIENDNRTSSLKTLNNPLQQESGHYPEVSLPTSDSSLHPEVSPLSLCPEVSTSSLCPEVSPSTSTCPVISLAIANTVEADNHLARDLTQLAAEYSTKVGELNTVWRTFTTELLHHVHLQQTSQELEHTVASDSEVLQWTERSEQDVRIKIDDIMNSVDKLITFSCHSNGRHGDEHGM